MAFGRFPLDRDEGRAFVVLPQNSHLYLSENLIRPGKETGPVFYTPALFTGAAAGKIGEGRVGFLACITTLSSCDYVLRKSPR